MTMSLDARAFAPAPSNGWYGAASAQVSQFLLRLRGLPLSAWLAATETRTPHRPTTGDPSYVPLMEELAEQAARHRLHAALETMPAVVSRIRVRIEELVAVFDGIVPERSLMRMRRAARLAALALAARPLLPAEDVARLCWPFRDLVPLR